MRALINQMILGFLRLLPAGLMKHITFLLRNHPEITDAWGVHVRSIHYYEPLPDFRSIQEVAIHRRRENPSVDFRPAEQAALAGRLATAYRAELDELAQKPEPEGFPFANEYFTGLDASAYYALIRDLKPARIVEIGSGYSTRIASKALARNRAEGRNGELVCIEPYPEPRLTEAKLDIRLVQQRVEEVDLSEFTALRAGDILFIDSSHAAKFGSDVCHEFLEILPRLQPGVWVHVHDIFFPHDYPAEWLLKKRIAFNEQYLLEAFLSFNGSFSVELGNYWLALDHPEVAEKLCPSKCWHQAHLGRDSLWMRRRS